MGGWEGQFAECTSASLWASAEPPVVVVEALHATATTEAATSGERRRAFTVGVGRSTSRTLHGGHTLVVRRRNFCEPMPLSGAPRSVMTRTDAQEVPCQMSAMYLHSTTMLLMDPNGPSPLTRLIAVTRSWGHGRISK